MDPDILRQLAEQLANSLKPYADNDGPPDGDLTARVTSLNALIQTAMVTASTPAEIDALQAIIDEVLTPAWHSATTPPTDE